MTDQVPGDQTIGATVGTETSTTVPLQQTKTEPRTPPGEDYKARYDGTVRKIEQLVTAGREKDAQLEALASELEQLKQQLNIKDTEKTVAVNEQGKALEAALTENQSLKSEVDRLLALELKIQVANELGQPQLISLADTIPNMTDKEALTTVMKQLNDYTASQVKAREEQLMAGVTPAVGPAAGGTVATPQTSQSWQDAINAAPLGSPERKKLLDQYGDWLQQVNQPQTPQQ